MSRAYERHSPESTLKHIDIRKKQVYVVKDDEQEYHQDDMRPLINLKTTPNVTYKVQMEEQD